MSFSIRRGLEQLKGYEYGERTAKLAGIARLNTNETASAIWDSSYFDSVRALPLNRYPDPTCQEVREALARLHGIPKEWILIGNGSDELLSLAARAFISPNDRVAILDPTYKLYETLIHAQQGHVVTLPVEKSHLPEYLSLDSRVTLSIVARPNSPCGRVVPREVIRNWPTPLILDEAYAEFMDEEMGLDVWSLVQARADVLFLRTLSKAWGLAGLRIGYAIANPQTLARLILLKDSYSVSTLSIGLAAAALARPEVMWENVRLIRKRREELRCWMQGRRINVTKSQGNFLWWECDDSDRIAAALSAQGVWVRSLRYSSGVQGVRCTIGSESDIAALKEAMLVTQIAQ